MNDSPSLMPMTCRAHRRSMRAQRGLSLLGLLIIAGLVALGAMLTLKIAPTVTEYLAIKRAIVKARSDGVDVRTIRAVFDRAAAIDDITSIDGKDLIVERLSNGEYSISFDYEKRVELFGPVSLIISYQGETGKAASVRLPN